ncbi:MAG: hypothetical protein HRU19_04520 [Pseudobacteriovorax sp.]|nr:hypothetical protein [Pseudobacteriovorax sp.]
MNWKHALGIKLVIIMGFLFSCQTKLSHRDIQICRLFCEDRSGLHQIILDPFKGTGCHCQSTDIQWLQLGVAGPYSEKLAIDQEELEPEASETEEDTEDSEDSEKVKEPETSDNDTTKPSIDEGR